MQSINRSNHVATSRLIVFAILLIGFGFRLFQLDHNELRNNEAFGYFLSLHSLSAIVSTTIELQEPYPVASHFVAHGWLSIAGDTVFALRFLSVWFGLLSVALIYRLTLCLKLNPITAYLAAFLLAINPYTIAYSQDARMYCMSQALTIALVWLAIEWLQRQRTQYAIAYILCATVALYTHYFAAYILLALYIFVLSRALCFPGLQNSVINLLAPLFFIALLYSPWYERAVTIFSRYNVERDSAALQPMLMQTMSAFSMGVLTTHWQQLLWAGVALLCLLFAVATLLVAGQQYRRIVWLLILYLLVPLIVIGFGGSRLDTFNERTLIELQTPFLILLAAGAEYWLQKWQQLHDPAQFRLTHAFMPFFAHVALRVLIIGGMVIYLGQYYQDPALAQGRGIRALATQLNELATGYPSDETIFVQTAPNWVLQYYIDKEDYTLITLPKHSSGLHDGEYRGGEYRGSAYHESQYNVRRSIAPSTQRMILMLSSEDPLEISRFPEVVRSANMQLVDVRAIEHWNLFVYERAAESPMVRQNK